VLMLRYMVLSSNWGIDINYGRSFLNSGYQVNL